MQTYVSPHPWSADRPDALVVCCSDGRFLLHIEAFMLAKVSEKPDLLAIPGGPACIDPWTSSFDHGRVFEESFRLLFGSHDIASMWLMAHEGCSFYRTKHPHAEAAELRALQVRDLSRARQKVRESRPGLAVHLVYVGVEGDRVQFSDVNESEKAIAATG